MLSYLKRSTNMKYIAPEPSTDGSTKIETGSHEIKFTNPGIGIRHLQSLLLASCIVCSYLQRVNLSVTIVGMIKLQNRTKIEHPDEFAFPMYDWDNSIRGYLLSSFFLGYFFMNFPAAYLGVYFDSKMLLLASCSVNGVLTCITPFLINLKYSGTNEVLSQAKHLAGDGNWRVLAVLRVVQGILQAFIFPMVYTISAKWAPPNERSRLVGFIMSGMPFGTTITLAGSGLLAGNPSLGWPSVFYVSGAVGLIWCFFWALFGSSSPSTHATISSNEYNYICSKLPKENDKSKKKIPWLDIFTCPAVYAIIIAHMTHSWGFWLLLNVMPTFLNAVSGFDIKSDGLLSSVPYITAWMLQFPIMWLADRMNKRGVTSLTVSRKLFSTIGIWGKSIGFVVLGYFNDYTAVAVSLYIICVCTGACSNVGFSINHMDLTSNYAGILMGLSNTFAATGGFGSALIVGTFVHDVTSVSEWRIVFYIVAGIMFFGNLIYLIFGSGKTQPWNNKYADTRL